MCFTASGGEMPAGCGFFGTADLFARASEPKTCIRLHACTDLRFWSRSGVAKPAGDVYGFRAAVANRWGNGDFVG